MQITLEDVPETVPEQNRVAWMKFVNRLMKQSTPGNWAWRTLENDFGFSGDYVYGQDEGEPCAGNIRG